MEQLHCEFVFEPIDELKRLKVEEWYFDSEGDIADFYTKIEDIKEFKIPLKFKPLRFSVHQEEV